eukprot:359816-Chlamydomonas_euryale.AAC.4
MDSCGAMHHYSKCRTTLRVCIMMLLKKKQLGSKCRKRRVAQRIECSKSQSQSQSYRERARECGQAHRKAANYYVLSRIGASALLPLRRSPAMSKSYRERAQHGYACVKQSQRF